MNRPAVGPQSLRGLPNGFPSQQQLPQQNRSVSNRLPPSGKMPNNGSTWAFGGGVPMGAAGLGNPRPNNSHMTSFAQTIGGSSQAAAPLDLSEFPSLSNNQPQPSQSTWAASGSRNPGPSSNLRLQQQLSAQQQTQQQQQDDLFNSSSQLPSSQGAFRFGNQNAVGQSSQSQPQSQSNSEEFPPLNRNVNGDIGQDRSLGLMQNVGFGAQSNTLGFGSAAPPQPNRNNGLLNALSGSNRVPPGNRVASPTHLSGLPTSRSPIDTNAHALGGVPESHQNQPFPSAQFTSPIPQRDEINHNMARSDVTQPADGIPRPSQAPTTTASPQNNVEDDGPEYHDPLARMSDADKYGLKGLTFMMHNFSDYAGLVTGTDLTNLGFDLNSNEQYSTQIFSLFDNEPAMPAVAPHFSLPDCYRVQNIAQLDTKMTNFNDEALIFMFYSNPGGVHQVMAAQELHARNWRFHKKMQIWLTKDHTVQTQTFGGSEHGSFIVFDIKTWARDRRQFTLIYDELEQSPPVPSIP